MSRYGKEVVWSLMIIDVLKYKQTLWNTVSEVIEIAKYPIEDLAKKFVVKS